MSKDKPSTNKVEKILSQPTIYTFNFRDVPLDKYAQTLDVLFRDPDFAAGVERRNRLVYSAKQLRSGSSEITNLLRTIQQQDKKLADTMYAAIVKTNLTSDVSLEFLSFTTLLRYYTDYMREGVRERIKTLTRNLYKVTFLADMLESVVVDVKSDMQFIFNDQAEFLQFDGVVQVLNQLRGYFKSVRPQDTESAEAQLYLDYADSINDYLAKRLKTYTEKVAKMHPDFAAYTSNDLLEALNHCLPATTPFDESYIQYTETKCPYVNAFALLEIMSDDQKRKFTKAVTEQTGKRETDEPLSYCFAVTDTFLNLYRRKK